MKMECLLGCTRGPPLGLVYKLRKKGSLLSRSWSQCIRYKYTNRGPLYLVAFHIVESAKSATQGGRKFKSHILMPGISFTVFLVCAISGKMAEFDQPKKLLEDSSSLFARLVAEYWANAHH